MSSRTGLLAVLLVLVCILSTGHSCPASAGKFLKSTNKPGIYRDKTMANKLLYIHNYDIQNYPFCKLKLGFRTFEYFMNQPIKKSAKLLRQQIRKRYCKTLGTSVIKKAHCPPSLFLSISTLISEKLL